MTHRPPQASSALPDCGDGQHCESTIERGPVPAASSPRLLSFRPADDVRPHTTHLPVESGPCTPAAFKDSGTLRPAHAPLPRPATPSPPSPQRRINGLQTQLLETSSSLDQVQQSLQAVFSILDDVEQQVQVLAQQIAGKPLVRLLVKAAQAELAEQRPGKKLGTSQPGGLVEEEEEEEVAIIGEPTNKKPRRIAVPADGLTELDEGLRTGDPDPPPAMEQASDDERA